MVNPARIRFALLPALIAGLCLHSCSLRTPSPEESMSRFINHSNGGKYKYVSAQRVAKVPVAPTLSKIAARVNDSTIDESRLEKILIVTEAAENGRLGDSALLYEVEYKEGDKTGKTKLIVTEKRQVFSMNPQQWAANW